MTPAAEGIPNLHTALEEAISIRDRERTEALWEELAKQSTDHLGVFLAYSDKIAKSGAPAQASLLLQLLVPDLMQDKKYAEVYEILKKAADHTPTDRDVRGQIVDCVRKRYESNSMLEKALQNSRLTTPTDLRRALGIFETFIGLGEGGYVYHEAGWGVGKISEIDFESDEVLIDFKARKSHKMSFSAMGKMLKQLPPDHLRVQLEYAPEALKDLARSDPAGLIKKVLRDEGRALNLRQIRALLVGPVISESGWSKWWSDARGQLKRDTSVTVGSGNNPMLELQYEVVGYEDSVLRKFEAARTTIEKIGVVREFLANKTEADTHKFLVPAATELLSRLASPQTPPEERFVLLMAYREALPSLPERAGASVPTPDQFLLGVEDIPRFLEKVAVEDYRRQAVDLIPNTSPDAWPAIYHGILLADLPTLWDAAYRGLISNKRQDVVRDAFGEIYRERDDRSENFAWFCRGVILGRIPASMLDHSRADFMEYLLILLDKVGSERGTVTVGQDARLLANRLRHILFNEVGDGLTKILEEAGQERTRQLLGLVEHNRGLNDHHRITIETKAYTLFPRLDVREETRPHEEENAIYVTEPGLHKREAELHRLVAVELPRVAQEIGQAKSFGDLSENAEYAAALEKQAQLAKRATDLQAELKKAKIISPEIVRTDQVSIGTRITLRNVDRGFLETFTILGPWDADFEKRIISYRAALAQGLLGHRKGDKATVDLPEGKAAYEVMAIVSAIS